MKRNVLIAISSVFAVVSLAANPPLAQQAIAIPSEYRNVLTILGRTGTYQDRVLLIELPRNELKPSIAGMSLPTQFGFVGQVALAKGAGDMEVLMGELALTAEEVNPVLSLLLDSGFEVTALHHHYLGVKPELLFLHVRGRGRAASLARKIKPALDLIGKQSAAQAGEYTEIIFAPADAPLDLARLDKIVGRAGTQTDSVYQYLVGRPDLKILDMGALVNARMGLKSSAAFYGSDENAVVSGEIACLESELTSVLKSLRKNGLEATAVVNHMINTRPLIIFVHYWGTGRSEELARGFKAALGELGRAR